MFVLTAFQAADLHNYMLCVDFDRAKEDIASQTSTCVILEKKGLIRKVFSSVHGKPFDQLLQWSILVLRDPESGFSKESAMDALMQQSNKEIEYEALKMAIGKLC